MILTLATISAIIFWVIYFTDCEIIISAIKGLMVGALYNDDEFDGETEHTIQILVFFFSINFIWTTFKD
jgi:hypothetical protein